jgi:GT2 family glycosyltransferase
VADDPQPAVEPRFSVVIPTFNRRDDVLKALHSALAQRCVPHEVLVVDDASTDGTPAVVEAWLAARERPCPVRVLRMPVNGGPSKARNAGIAAASGTHIAFLDSDDEWLPDKLARQREVLQTLARAAPIDHLVLYGQVLIRRRHESLVRPVRAKRDDEPLAEYLFANGGYFDQNSVVIPTPLAQRHPYRTDLRQHEDWDLYLRLEAEGVRFVMCDGPLSVTHDLASTGRASGAGPEASLAWIDQWQDRLPRRAVLGLRARVAPLLRGRDSLRAVHLIVQALREGAVSPLYALGLFGRLLHPGLRDTAYRLRGWWSNALRR